MAECCVLSISMLIHCGCDVLGHRSHLSWEEDLLCSSLGGFSHVFSPLIKVLSVIFWICAGLRQIVAPMWLLLLAHTPVFMSDKIIFRNPQLKKEVVNLCTSVPADDDLMMLLSLF